MKKINIVLSSLILLSGTLMSCNPSSNGASYRDLTKQEALDIVHKAYDNAKTYEIRKGESDWYVKHYSQDFEMHKNVAFDLDKLYFDDFEMGNSYRFINNKLLAFRAKDENNDECQFLGVQCEGKKESEMFIKCYADDYFEDFISFIHVPMLKILLNDDEELASYFDSTPDEHEDELNFTSFELSKSIMGTNDDLDIILDITYHGVDFDNVNIKRSYKIKDNKFCFYDREIKNGNSHFYVSREYFDYIKTGFKEIDQSCIPNDL